MGVQSQRVDGRYRRHRTAITVLSASDPGPQARRVLDRVGGRRREVWRLFHPRLERSRSLFRMTFNDSEEILPCRPLEVPSVVASERAYESEATALPSFTYTARQSSHSVFRRTNVMYVTGIAFSSLTLLQLPPPPPRPAQHSWDYNMVLERCVSHLSSTCTASCGGIVYPQQISILLCFPSPRPVK